MRQNVNAARLAVSLIRLLEAGTGGVVIISRKSIQELLNVSMPTVDRCIAVLVEGGWVHRVKIGGPMGLASIKKVAWVGKLKMPSTPYLLQPCSPVNQNRMNMPLIRRRLNSCQSRKMGRIFYLVGTNLIRQRRDCCLEQNWSGGSDRRPLMKSTAQNLRP